MQLGERSELRAGGAERAVGLQRRPPPAHDGTGGNARAMDIGLEVSELKSAAVLAVHGEVDVATAPRLREQVLALVADGYEHIVIDLEGVEFLDSTGLGVLVGALKRVRTHGGELSLVCTRPRVLKVFEITGLTRVFAIHGSVASAVATG
ncbi:hypothetical protein BH18ACT4_BH18ACT4_06720 [soil metagenome]